MIILNGVVHTMDGETIDSGYIRVEDGIIQQVGHMANLPSGVEPDGAIDARGGHILPGLMDIHCHLGLCGCDGEDLNETSQVCTSYVRVLDGVNPFDPYIKEAREAGVTCVMVHPGSTNPIAGQSLLMKTAGRIVDQMAVRTPAAMKFSLGENPKGRDGWPATRMGTAALIREMLTRASEYQLKWETARADPQQEMPSFDPNLDALRGVVSGEVPAHFHVHRADDIATAVRIAKEFGLDYAIVHGTEGYLMGEYLAQEGVPVITGPILTDRSKGELRQMSMANTAMLAKAGVQVAICTDHPETTAPQLLLCAAMAARWGMDEEEALAAITINAACIAGVDHRMGSITQGKDADLVVLDGHPLDWRSKVTHVFIDGQEV